MRVEIRELRQRVVIADVVSFFCVKNYDEWIIIVRSILNYKKSCGTMS